MPADVRFYACAKVHTAIVTAAARPASGLLDLHDRVRRVAGLVVNRAFTAYSHLPNSSIVVGTSKLELVMRPTMVPAERPVSSSMTAIWFKVFWTT